MSAAHAPAAPFALAVDPARFALVQSIRLWKIEVRLAAEKLLSLGQAYEVQYTFPRVRVPGLSLGECELRDFGFDVMPVAGSHLFKVNEVRTSRFQQRIVDTGLGDGERIASIGLDDYFVGIGVDNLLLLSMKMPRLRRRVSDVLKAAEREQEAGKTSTVRLRFVHYDTRVRVDPAHNRAHGQILQSLDELDAYHARLAKQYETLVTRHRESKKHLQVEKKVLMFVRIILHETRTAVMKIPEFQFIADFRSWYKVLDECMTEDACEDDEDDQEDGEDFEFGDDKMNDEAVVTEKSVPDITATGSPEGEPELIDLTHPDTIDDESEDEDVVEVLDLAPAASASTEPKHTRRLERATSVQTMHPPRPHTSASIPRRLGRANSLPSAVDAQGQPPPQRPRSSPPPPPPPQRVSGPTSKINASWINRIPGQSLKWMKNAKSTLETFTNGIADSFQADFEGDERIPALSCTIAEALFCMYLRKRGSVVDSVLQKEFVRHARMLRSNIKNAHNPELRRDLVIGTITPQRLCEMTSDELAPEALRKERELRYEQHARQNMLREPTGRRLMKTKHGFKEVGFSPSGAETEAMALPTLATIDLGRPTVPESEMTEQAPTSAHNNDPNGDVVMDDNAYEPDVEDDRTSGGDDSSPQPHAASSTESNTVESEVSKRFQAAVDIRDKAKQPAKRVTFSFDSPAAPAAPAPPRARAPARSATDHTSIPKASEEKVPAKDHHRRRRDVVAADGKAFLITLFGPTYDVIAQLQDWAKDLGRVSMSSMSHEFDLAPGVKFYRELYSSSHGTYLATVQLGHIQCEASSRSDHDATYKAVESLLHALGRYQRLFGDLLTKLSGTYRLNPTNDTRQVRDAAFGYLVESKVVELTTTEVRRFQFGAEIVEFDVVAAIDDLPLAHARASSSIRARADAVQQLMTFLMVLVGQFEQNMQQRQEDYRAQAPAVSPVSEPASSELTWKSEPLHSLPPRAASPEHTDIQDESFEPFESFDEYHKSESENPRKRRYDHSTQPDDLPLDRDSTRRRVDTPTSVEEPTFYVDDVGERPRVQAPRLDVVMKQQAEAYQELLTMVFRDEAAVLSQLRDLDWKDQDEAIFTFSRKIQMTGNVSRDSTGTFTCTLVGVADILEAKSSGRTALDAKESAINLMAAHIRRIHDCWKTLVRTFKERSKVVSTLMASHETRQKHRKLAVNSRPGIMRIVEEDERLIAPYHVFSVYIDGKLAVSAAAVSLKDAKRAASEFFRDVMEELVRIEARSLKAAHLQTAQSGSRNGISSDTTSCTSTSTSTSTSTTRASASASTITASSNSTASTSAINSTGKGNTATSSTEPKRTKPVVLSDASDDDDYYSSGGESDWDPDELKDGGAAASASTAEALTPVELMKQSYDLQSESGASDDAKFRAVIRSLFTPADDLCAGINHLRGSLKYRGVAEKVVVPNVKASIRINRLREGLFEVRVDVNDVVHCMEARTTKPDAINAAIDGILGTLSVIRSEWVQLLHFLHVKCLSDTFLSAYKAMKLAGIISIKPTIEAPPSTGRNGMGTAGLSGGVHCVIRAGRNVVFRVTGRTEAEALLVADCRTAKFFEHLIDLGLDPEPMEDEKDGVVDNDGALTAVPPIDWSCQIRVQDSGNCDELHDFRVDAHWIHPRMAPSEREFPRQDITAVQTGIIPIAEMEQMLLNRHESAVVFFRLESTYNQQKLVKCVAAFGHKARSRTSALKFQLAGGSRFSMYVIPPGATINSSDKNLYWPAHLPREIASNYRHVHGFLTPKHL